MDIFVEIPGDEDSERLTLRQDSQGDLYVGIRGEQGYSHTSTRFCGPCGGSRVPVFVKQVFRAVIQLLHRFYQRKEIGAFHKFKVLNFEATAIKDKDGITAIWTDGWMVSRDADGDGLASSMLYRGLINGKKYHAVVIVMEVEGD